MVITHPPLSSVDAAAVLTAAQRLRGVVKRTALEFSPRLSEQYDAEIFLKREDQQVVRSYKLRGAYNKITSLTADELDRGVICASAGNHAQGVAWTCRQIEVSGVIVMPGTTPQQKIAQVKRFGGKYVEIILHGDTFDEAHDEARRLTEISHRTFIHPFDDAEIIAGQGTVGLEIWEDATAKPDFVVLPVGGGGLAAGVSTYLQSKSESIKIIGVEPAGAPSMQAAIKAQMPVQLSAIDSFVDGAAVKAVGKLNYTQCAKGLQQVLSVDEGAVCQHLLDLYEQDAIVAEPAGALSVAALDQLRESIKGKKVVCVVSGGNNDLGRIPEIRERAMLWQQRRHYFMLRFPQRAGALAEFVNQVLEVGDDIILFEYARKHQRARGPVLIGIELPKGRSVDGLRERMNRHRFCGEYLNEKPDLLRYLL